MKENLDGIKSMVLENTLKKITVIMDIGEMEQDGDLEYQ